MTFSSAALSAQSPGLRVRGDVTQDGQVTASDALAVLSSVVGRTIPTGYRPYPNGDSDGSGRLSALDAVLILKYAAGLDVAAYPVGQPLREITVTTDTLTLEAGEQRSIEAAVVSDDSAVRWSSSNSAVASVDAHGAVSALAEGRTTVTVVLAADTSVRASVAVTVQPASVGAISLSPTALHLVIGNSASVAATLKDARGGTLSGRAITWASSDSSVATVTQQGTVAARAVGTATITAASGGRSASITAYVAPPAAARISVSPGLTVLKTGGSAVLTARASDARGDSIAAAPITWSSLQPATASVDTAGSVRGIGAGVAQIVAGSGSVADTATVAVLGTGDMLVSVMAGSDPRADVTPGQTITVTVRLDMSNVSSTGDLGSLQFDLIYDNTLLEYVSSRTDARGAAQVGQPSPGRLRCAFASTDAQGRADFSLVTLTFHVVSNASPGMQSTFGISDSGSLLSTEFHPYRTPITVLGSTRVVAP